MRKLFIAALACAGMLGLSACGEAREIQNSASEEQTTASSAATTVTTTATAVTTTVTSTLPPLSDFTETEDLKLEAKENTVNDEGGVFCLTNQSGGQRTYQTDFRIIDAATGAQVRTYPAAEEEKQKPKKIAAGETVELKVNWYDRCGRLKGGDYYYELLISMDQQSGNRIVCRAPFSLVEAVFTPVVTIDPDSITPEKLRLHIQNSNDCGRSYGLAYRMLIFDENGRESVLFRVTDTEARVKKNYHMDAGGSLDLVCDWTKQYGSLLEGKYAIEIDLLADGSENAKAFRAEFEIV